MIRRIKEVKPFVIGIGIAGKRHLEAQLNLGIKTGVFTTNPQTAKSLQGNPNIIVFDKLEDGINWSNLVHVCTPDDKHTEYVAMALKKRKNVLCEKSFTTNLKDALKLQKLAQNYNCLLIIGQNYRLTPTFLEIRKRVLRGQIGAITRIKTTYYHDKNKYQQKYNDKYFLYIGGSHAVDLACWFVGEQITDIKIFHASPLRYKIEIKFSSGILADVKLDASSTRQVNGTDLLVYGEKGRLVSHNKLDKLLFYKNGHKNPNKIFLQNSKTLTVSLEVKIIDNYLTGKVSNHWPLPGVDEAVDTIKVLDTIQKAVSFGTKIFCN